MKLLLFPLLAGMSVLPVSNQFAFTDTEIESPGISIPIENNNEVNEINFQDGPWQGKISSVVFKSQDYCRAELENFEFDIHFAVVSANVYFSGNNFKGVQKGSITSNSLKPIKSLMKQCVPGSIVIFDDVKVKGPDNEIRTIAGLTLTLY